MGTGFLARARAGRPRARKGRGLRWHTSGAGACAVAGKTVCDGLEAVTCDAVAAEPGDRELCGNLIDDDCDGELDEGFEDLGTACTRKDFPCPGVWVCGDTALVCMTAFEPTADEVCDGLDNNCDGNIDEGFDVGLACEVGVGQCRAAANFVCAADGNAVVCGAEQVESQAELCDELDNDCDGASDEDFDLTSDAQNCGACGESCAEGSACCDSGCLPILEDADNCGACGVVCELPHTAVVACTAGECQVTTCDDGWGDCTDEPGCETDLRVTVDHCDTCDAACEHETVQVAVCADRACFVAECDEDRDDCDGGFENGCEIDLNADDDNCGACGVVCGGNQADVTCLDGECSLQGCDEGYRDCDGFWQNGCEVFTDRDLDHCGNCGELCEAENADVQCDEGDCVVGDCRFGYWDLDEEPGCEYGPCVPTGDEVCDGEDNDCDGLVDAEDPDLEIVSEALDSLDNDCDGFVDETFDLDHDGVCEGCDGVDAVDVCPTVWNPHNGDADVLCPTAGETPFSRPMTLTEPGRAEGTSTWRRTNEPIEVPLVNGILDESVVLYMKLDGNGIDRSPQGNVANQRETPQPVEGAFGSDSVGMHFGPQDAFIFDQMNGLDIDEGGWSLAWWMKHSPYPEGEDYHGIISFHHAVLDAGFSVLFDGEPRLWLYNRPGESCRAPFFPSNARVDDDSWHHVAFVKSGPRGLSAFVDGVLTNAGETDVDCTLENVGDGPLSLGCPGDYCPNSRDLHLDDVVVLRRSLSPYEVNALYRSGSPFGSQLAPNARDDFGDLVVQEDAAQTIPREIIGPRPHSDAPCPDGADPQTFADRDDMCGVAAYWRFDQNLRDVEGIALEPEACDDRPPLCIVGDPTFAAGRFGDAGGSLRLDGIDDGVNLWRDREFRFGRQYTIEVWVRPFGDVDGPIVSSTTGDVAHDAGLGLDIWNDRTVFVGAYWAADGNLILTADVDLRDGGWHHLAGVRDGTWFGLYIDGLLTIERTSDEVPDNFDAGNQFCVGQQFHYLDRRVYVYAGIEVDKLIVHDVAKSSNYLFNRARPALPTVRFLAHTHPEERHNGFEYRDYTLEWGGELRRDRPTLTGLDRETRCDGLLNTCLGYAGWWDFDETAWPVAVDRTTLRNHGRSDAGASPAAVIATPWGRGLGFGGNSLVNVPHIPAYSFPAGLSLETAFFVTGDGPHGIVGKVEEDRGIVALWRDDRAAFGARFNVDVPGVAQDEWRRVAATFDQTVHRGYLDFGAPVEFTDPDRQTADVDADLLFGAVSTVPGPLRGGVDFVRLSNRPLAPDELLHLPRTVPSLGPCSGCPEVPNGFVLIPAGDFTMGSPDGEEGRDNDELRHQVTISRPFLIQETEVTQGQWRSLMGNNPSGFPTCGDDCPVEMVNWWEAVAYANELSANEGLPECYELRGCTGSPGEEMTCAEAFFAGLGCPGYRLPTEAEWEYATRAGTTGARYADLDDIAWYDQNSDGMSHPVARNAPNSWGLYDTLGNVWEWVHDWYDTYPQSPIADPVGPPDGQYRIHRGGGWNTEARYARAAPRSRDSPGGVLRSYLGFRVARTQP